MDKAFFEGYTILLNGNEELFCKKLYEMLFLILQQQNKINNE